MSILKSLNTGLSGINGNSRAISVVGDNIANMNTIGYKESRANFESALSGTTLGGNIPGDGMSVSSVQQSFEQGTLKKTGRQTDMAISGNGFFIAEGDLQGEQGQYYTRAGQFNIDDNGFLTTGDGLRVQGYGTRDDGTVDRTGGLQDLRVGGNQSTAAQESQNLTANVNLDASATDISGGPGTTTEQFDPDDPSGTSNFSSTTTLHDSLGNEIQATVYYTKNDDLGGASTPNETEWEYNVVVDSSEVEGGEINSGSGNSVVGKGRLSFDSSGELVEQTGWDRTAGPPSYSSTGSTDAPDPANGISFNPAGSPDSFDIAVDFSETTQYNSSSIIRSIDSDGRQAGELQNINVEKDGTVIGTFSNGETQNIGQVATATFDSNNGLRRQGKNYWRDSRDSGGPAIGTPGSGGRGGIVSGSLEASNVDLAHQFTKLTANQRAFQASSKTVTTSNQLLQQTINLKR